MTSTPQPPSDASGPLPLKRFAALVGVSHCTLRKLCNAGIVPRYPDGTIPAAEGYQAVQRYLASRGDRRSGRLPASAPALAPAPPPPPRPEPPPSPPRPEPPTPPAPAPRPPPAPRPTPAPHPEPPPSAPLPRPMPGPLAESASVAAATSRAKMAEQNFRAELAALKYRRAAGELVPLVDVRIELQRVFSAVVACLRAVPPRLGGAAEGRDASEIERIAAKMIDDAFAEFQRVKLPGAEP